MRGWLGAGPDRIAGPGSLGWSADPSTSRQSGDVVSALHEVRTMIRMAWIGLIVLLGTWTQGSGADDPVAAAESAAQTWLGLLDNGDYSHSWSTAAKPFRESISESQWTSRISAVRVPLGGVKSRKVISARFERALPGAPDGEYVVIQFSTTFEHKAAATETVTPMKDA